jgi:uncharacterized membrane protein
MSHRLNLFLMALVSIGLLDGLWLGVMTSACSRSSPSLIARMSRRRLAPLWTPALVFYVVLAFGIVVFVLPGAPGEAPLASGALLGLIVFGMYDVSSLATQKKWPVLLTAVDIAWGAAAAAATTWVVALGHRWLH